MTTTELRDKLLRVVWAEDSDQTPEYVHQDVAIAVNQALQEIWTAPRAEFLRRRSATFSTVNGTSSYTLPTNLIELLGPVTTPTRTLTPMSNKGDFQNFTARFLQADSTAASGESLVYYLERTNSSNTDADPVTVKMLLAPTPGSAYTVTYEAAFEPPSLTKCDLEDNTTIPAPHSWLESIVLPIAQFHMLDSHWFSRTERTDTREAIVAKYRQARMQLGLADPQIKTVTYTERKPSPAPVES